MTVVANDPVDQTFLGWYNGDELLSNDKEYTHLVEDSITLTAKFAIAEQGFAYEVLNPETDPDGKFAVYTDEEVNGTTAPLSENTWGNVPEGRKTFFKEIQYRYGYTIAVDAEGYIVYASYGLNNGYGSPADGFYSRVGGEGKNNPIFYVADNWAPWPDPNFGSFDWVVPEGGFVVTGLATHPTMVNLIKHLTGATSVPTNNNALFETQTADGSLDKWHLSLTEIGNIRVQDRTNLQDEPNYVTAPVVVTGGTVNGEATANLEANSMVTVVADTQEGTIFAGWYNEYDEHVSSDVSYTFKLSASGATLTAKFVNEIEPAVELTVNVENATITAVNDQPYVEGETKIHFNDTVTVEKAEDVEFVKWQQDGVDVSSSLESNVPVVKDEPYTFVAQKETTTIKAVTKQEYSVGSFDVAVGLDGFGSLNSYWTTGQTIQKGTTLANEWRTLITVDTTGKITAISYGVHSPVTVGEGFVIAGHDATVNEFLTYALGTDTVINDKNRNTIYADLLAMADNLTLSVTDGVLTVTKTTVEPEPTPDYSIGQITEANQEYTVRGLVVAKNTRALVVSDGTDSVYVFDNSLPSQYNIGDYVEVTGGVTSYNKAFQFAYNGNPAVSVTKLDEDPALTIPEATLLTTEIVNSWTTAEAFTTADIKEYTWTAVAGKSGNYDTLNLAGADVTIEPIGIDSDVYTIVTGKTYEVKAYFIGYYNYASIVLTELKEVVIPVEGITIEANRTEVTVGQSVTFTATLTPQGAFGEVTYAITEGTELGSIEGNVLTTTGAGTIKVQASVDELTSNEVIITITEATEPAPETPVETSFEMKGFATTAGGYQEEDQTAEFDGVTYVAKNYIGQSGQIRGKETSVSKNFQLANTTEMPGVITKIEIISTATGTNKFSASMKVAVGTTSQADVASVENCIDGTLTSNTHMTFEFDVAEGITYFKLLSEAKFTSGSLTGCTIKITYMV